MTDIEITSLFSNLLDNAIEACEGCEGKTLKKIILRIHRHQDYIVINLKNNLPNPIVIADGTIKSTKERHKGLGLKIVKEIVERHDGCLDYEYDEQWFTVKISFQS